MANEITIGASVSVVNGNFTYTRTFSNLQFDQTTGAGGNPGTIDIGTSEEDIAIGDIGTLGYAIMRNLDDTNYIQLGPKDTTMKTMVRLKPGQVALMPLEPGITLRAAANTASCKLWLAVFEGD